jgi:hypothetical protein
MNKEINTNDENINSSTKTDETKTSLLSTISSFSKSNLKN